jgi:pyruvyltransferase
MKSMRQTWVWRAGKRFAADPARRTIVNLFRRGRIPLAWVNIPNWGDALNPVLVELISGRKTQLIKGLYSDRYLAIGSILGGANSRAVVWGSGFATERDKVVEPPRTIHAVRGPLSRDLLIKQGVDCPEIFGDPALLLPRFFNPKIVKTYKVGIVPHFSDKGHAWVEKHRNNPQVLIIDIESGIGNFVRSVKSCEMILSSSLHGLICADAYGIPNAWIKLSDILLGGSFKFRDYRLSIMAKEPVPIDISTNPPLEAALAAVEFTELRIDLGKLLLACPFLDDNLREETLATPPGSCGLPYFFPKYILETAANINHLL